MKKEETKKPIMPLLRKLAVGETEVFPYRQWASINAGIQYLHNGTDLRFKRKKVGDTQQVTRIE